MRLLPRVRLRFKAIPPTAAALHPSTFDFPIVTVWGFDYVLRVLSEKPWNREVLLLFIAGLLISWCVGMLLGILLEQFLPPEALAKKSFYHFVITTLTLHVATLVLVHHFLKLSGANWKQFLGLTRPYLARAILFALVVGIVVLPIILSMSDWVAQLINSMAQHPPPEEPAIKVLRSTVGVGQRICFGVAAILIAPVAEEALFRGILYPFIKQLGRPRLAIWGTSLLFAAMHMNVVVFLPLMVLAMILTFVYEKTDKLVAPITTHALFNSVNFFYFLYAPQFDQLLRRLLHP